ncbi:MAG: pirin family protein, partial [Rhodospirillales bacterium]|nr:pirin family protein [Rhodospirillales bacterium]
MIEVRPFDRLGRFRNDWLNARHHFSFGHYRDPARAGFGRLLVWNDDEIAPGAGFDPHPHREMEIVTYIREGAITHEDSLGNVGRTEAGDVQVMHAGTGIVHAEYNREAGPTRLFQIWIRPDRTGVAPGWGTREFPRSGSGLRVLASGRAADAGAEALPLHADAAVLA